MPKKMDEVARRSIGSRIKAVRAISGLTQDEFSRVIHTAVPTCSNYELGKRELPISVALVMNAELGVSIPWLITGQGEMMEGQ